MLEGPINVGFLTEHVLGWVTHYANLRGVVSADPALRGSWEEISYYREGGRIETLSAGPLRLVPGYAMGNLRFALDFRKALYGQKFDAIVTNSRVGGMLHAGELARVPTIIEIDSTPRQFDRMSAYGIQKDPAPLSYLKWRLHRRMYSSARMVVAFSNWARRGLIEEYKVDPQTVIVNPPGVDLKAWHPGERANRHLGPKRILFVGGDFRRKGGALLLDWFRHTEPGQVELHLVTRERVGPTPGVYVYDNMRPNSEELRRLYQTADLFVLPSLGECFGLVTVEAMASGLPVIMSDVGGYADLVEHGGNGLVVPSGDARELGEAIHTLLGNRTHRVAMGTRSRQIAEERFNLKANADRMLSLIKSLVENREGRSGLNGPAGALKDQVDVGQVAARLIAK